MSENEVHDSSIVETNFDIKTSSKENVSHLKCPVFSANSTNAASKISPGFQHDSSPRSSTSSKEQGTVLTSDTAQFIIGQRVWVGGLSPGQIAYIGETHFAPGEWAGVVLDGPNGKNDGCVAGKRYFQCEAKKGIFSRLTRLTLYPLEGAITKGLSKMSPDRSSTVSPTPSTRSMISKTPGKHGFTLGDRVIVSSGFGSRAGTLRFLGETQFASGNWCGIELDDSSGKNDGSVDGVRYFDCLPKYGIFVPIAKVSLSPSSKKSRLSRAGSRESLTSVGTMNSIATTNTSRLRMQRRSSAIKPVNATKSTFSMQDLIREKQNHIEQLMIERDLDQEDAQNQALQLQKIITELKSKVVSLESKLEEEKSKTEDLQLSIEEATFCGDELNAQTQVYKEKITDLEQRLNAATLENQIQPPSGENVVPTSAYTLNAQSGNTRDTSPTLPSKTDIPENNHAAHEALCSFRELICKIKDFENHETDFQEKLKRYVADPEEIRRVHLVDNSSLPQTAGTFLTDLCESLTIALKELNVIKSEKEIWLTKCKDLENTLKTNGEEIHRLQAQKVGASRLHEDVTANLKSLSELSAKHQQEIKNNEDNAKRLEAEKLDISRKLEDVTSKCMSLTGVSEKQLEEIKTNEENIKRLEIEKLEISRKLEDVTASCTSLTEVHNKQHHEIKTNEQNFKRLEAEKFEISQKLADVTSKCTSLTEVNYKQQQKINGNEENLKRLEVEKFEISQKLEDVTSKCTSLTEVNDKQQQEINGNEENLKRLEVEKFEISQKLEDFTSKCTSLTEVNEKQQQEIKTNEEHLKRLEVEKFEISRKIEDVTSNCTSVAEVNEKQQQELKTNEENFKRLEVEKFEISRKLEDVTSNCTNLAEVNEKQQQELKTNEENLKRLEVEKFEISRKLEDATASCKGLTELTEKQRQEIETNEENMKQLELEKFDISRNLEELTSNCKSLSELNDKLQHELKVNEEKNNLLEVEKFDMSRKLADVTSNYENLSNLNDKLQQDLKNNDENTNLLELKNFEFSRQIEDLRSNCESLSDHKNKLQLELTSQKVEGEASNSESLSQLNNKLQLEIKAIEEKAKRFEVEKYDISRKFDDVSTNYKNLAEQNEKLQQELKTNGENIKRLELEQFDNTRKLESAISNCKSLSELNDKLQQELKTNEENTKRLEVGKFDVSQKLEDLTSKCMNLTELNGKLQQELKTNEEISKRLEEEKFDISRKLEDITSNCKSLSELNDKHHQEIKTNEENFKRLELEKFDISQKFEDVTSNCKSLTELNEKLQQELKVNEEKTSRLEVEKFDISRKLEDVISDCESLSGVKDKQQQEYKTNEENTKRLEVEKFEISQKLEDLTSNCKSLTELNNKLQQELRTNEENSKRLELEKFDVTKQLEDLTLKFTSLTELTGKLQQEIKTNEENSKRLEEEKFDISRKLEDITSNCKSLSELNGKQQQELKTNEENLKSLEQEKLNISQELSDLTSNSKSMSELNGKLQQELKTNEENTKQLEVEKLNISRKLEDVTANCKSLSELNDKLQKEFQADEKKSNQIQDKSLSEAKEKLQQELKTTEERVKQLELENVDISRKLEDVTLNYDSLSELNIKLQQELISRKLDVVTSNCESFSEHNDGLPQELISSRSDPLNSTEEFVSKQRSNKDLVALIRSVKSELETKYFEEVLKNNDILRQFKEKLSNIESELMNDPLTPCAPLEKELSSKGANAQIVKAAESINERQKVYQNMHNESISGRFHLDNQLQEVNQLLNLITMQMESLDQDIRSISPESKTPAELLSVTEEKSCKLQFDFDDLSRRFETLKVNCAKFNNENYYSLKELISVHKLKEANENTEQNEWEDENTLDELTKSISEQLGLLKEKATNYQLVFKAKEMELAKQLSNFSNDSSDLSYKLILEPNSEELVEIECMSNNLQIDLETTRSFIAKIEELKISLKSVSYSHFKLAKSNAQVSEVFNQLNEVNKKDADDLGLEKTYAQFEDANKKLQAECFELTEFLANIMEPFDSTDESFDKLKPTLNKSILQMSYIEGFVERMNELADSNSAMSNVLTEKIRLLQKMGVSLQTESFMNKTSNLSAVEEHMPGEPDKHVNNLHKKDVLGNQNTILQSKSVTGDRTQKSQTNKSQSTVESKAENVEDKTAQINFLNSIIADMQQKNDTLKAKITALETLSTDYQKSYLYNIAARKPTPRMFCDICDQFDLHETEDCPLQESDGGELLPLQSIEAERNNNKPRVLPEPRKYCENCEVFGNHTTEDCFGGLE